jgi:hypothetical protein
MSEPDAVQAGRHRREHIQQQEADAGDGLAQATNSVRRDDDDQAGHGADGEDATDYKA